MRQFGTLLLGVLVACMSGCVAPTSSPRWDVAELQPATHEVKPPERVGTIATTVANGAGDVSLATILHTVAAQNPLVEAAHSRWLAATHKRPQAIALPDPKLEYRYFARQMAREEEQWELGLSQDIPYPGKLLLAGKIADKEAEVAYVRYQMALRNAFAEAKALRREIYYIDRAQEITVDIETLYTRYAALAVGGTDVVSPNCRAYRKKKRPFPPPTAAHLALRGCGPRCRRLGCTDHCPP